MGPPLYMRSVVDRNVVMRRMTVQEIIVFPVVIYGCKTRFLTFREKHRVRLIENMMPREILGVKRDEVGEGET